ncbi:MAG: ribonuclease Z [Oscillospiraceae bacterium]|nr:ribonuclease Z [Oscillospiraceae bacterium]
MLEVTLPGTGGTMPLKNRWLTCCYVRQQGKSLLIDCGEGTQIALRCAGISVQDLSLLCITHYHADHISGLPGLLLSMGLDGRTAPLTIAGPPGLRRTVEGLRVIAPELPFPIEFREFTEKYTHLEAAGMELTAFPLYHTMPCVGYRMHLPRIGKFDPERAKAAGIPVRAWGMLQKQESVTLDGVTYTRDQVLGPPRRGLTVVYATDTRPQRALTEAAEGCDLLITEGMYGDPEKRAKAQETRHMLFTEAAETARDAHAKRLWLTHYSPSLPDPQEYLHHAKAIFPETCCAGDGQHIDLPFSEDDL